MGYFRYFRASFLQTPKFKKTLFFESFVQVSGPEGRETTGISAFLCERDQVSVFLLELASQSQYCLLVPSGLRLSMILV